MLEVMLKTKLSGEIFKLLLWAFQRIFLLQFIPYFYLNLSLKSNSRRLSRWDTGYHKMLNPCLSFSHLIIFLVVNLLVGLVINLQKSNQKLIGYRNCSSSIHCKGLRRFLQVEERSKIKVKTTACRAFKIWSVTSNLQFQKKYLTKAEKYSKTRQEKKSYISTFSCFLTAIANVWFLKGRRDMGLCLQPNLRFLQYFLIS